MLRKYFFIPLLFFSHCLCFQLSGTNKNLLSDPHDKKQWEKEPLLEQVEEPTTCGEAPRPYYVTLRHIEGHGVGYNQGYTTLEGFFRTPNLDTWVPFLDLRYHFFNNGKPAANAGLGLRYLATSRIWGINGYYDYRKTNHQHYNQISIGLESLGNIWDFRINGYLPVGKKTSGLFHARFEEFKNHYLYIRGKQEFVMKGANAEVGAHVNRYKNAPLYFALGPYYLEGQGKAAWGGEVRASADLFGYFRLEASTSYDNVFKWIGQGQISLVIPFGKEKQIQSKKGHSCRDQLILAKRAIQRVDRYEIIPVDRKRKNSVAIDPLTGKPYIFWFVNNESHSDGTFESPFPTLQLAQNASSPNDVIYVFPGDGTDTGMNAGISLQNGQQLLGAGLAYSFPTQFGTIGVPAQAIGKPSIANINGNVVTVTDNNYIAGCNINGGSATGIIASNILSGLVIDNNIILASTGRLIDITGSGPVRLTNNQCMLTVSFQAIRCTISGGPMNAYVNGNTISNGGSYGIGFNYTSGSASSLTISNNVIQAAFEGIFVGMPGTVSIDQNRLLGSSYGIGFNLTSSSTGSYTVSNNSMDTIGIAAIYINSGGIGTHIDIFDNSINQVGNAVSGGVFTGSCLSITQNQISNYTSGINLSFNSPSCFIDIEANTFTSNVGFGVQIASSTAGANNCVRCINNNCPTGSGYQFTASNGAVMNLEPTSSNIGTVTTSGTSPVNAGTCSCQN